MQKAFFHGALRRKERARYFCTQHLQTSMAQELRHAGSTLRSRAGCTDLLSTAPNRDWCFAGLNATAQISSSWVRM